MCIRDSVSQLKFTVPTARGETRSPVRPSVLYSMIVSESGAVRFHSTHARMRQSVENKRVGKVRASRPVRQMSAFHVFCGTESLWRRIIDT